MTKIDVISGFLGAGKTTLIKKLVEEQFQGENVVLVENEFGEIGIDGGFLKDAGVEIKEINSGCICCSLVGDFEEALKKVVETYHPDRILIEPSGVGKLSDILAAIQTVEGLEINSYSTVVDAKKCRIYSKNFKEFFNDQIATATCIILSKTQTLRDEQLEETVEIVKGINPKARIITTNWDDLDGKTIFQAMEGSIHLLDEDDICPVCGHSHHHHDHDEECCCEHDHDHEHHHHDHDEECCCEHEHDHEHHHHDHDEECCCGHDHDHEHHHHDHDEECCCGHDHDHEHHHHDHDEECSCGHHHHHHHHADEVFTSIGMETIKKYTKAELEDILSKLDENILRAKGIVANKEGGWLFFDFVPGDIDVREGQATYTGLITVIGSKVDEATIKELFGVK